MMPFSPTSTTSEDVPLDITSSSKSPRIVSHQKIDLNGICDSMEHNALLLPGAPRKAPVLLEWEDINYFVSLGWRRGRKDILKGLTGCVYPGELTAIMGPSGAGKSTLLNVLTGFIKDNVSGKILVNGDEKNIHSFHKLHCYITQVDYLWDLLTVEEAMNIASHLKLPTKVKKDDKKRLVNYVIEMLGLEECRNVLTCRLSGGQKKRLSIAVELVNNPSVLFIDEPTSGLDSSSSYRLVSLLKSLAKSGRTIVCTIHQPSARLFEKFDKLYLLTEGKCAYDGDVKDLLPFLTSHGLKCPPYHNCADFAIEVASGEHGDVSDILSNKKDANEDEIWKRRDFADISLAKKEKMAKQYYGPINNRCDAALNLLNGRIAFYKKESRFATGFCNQFYVVGLRTFLTIFRSPMLTQLRFAAHVFLGILIGVIYENVGHDAATLINNLALIIFSLGLIVVISAMPTVLTYPSEKGIVFREYRNNWYNTGSYYMAKFAADFIFQIAFTAVYTAIIYWWTGQPDERVRITLFFMISFLNSIVGQAYGLLLGTMFDSESATFITPCTITLFMMFSGFFVALDKIPDSLHWVTWVSFTRYGFEGYMVSLYGLKRPLLPCSDMFHCLARSPKFVLKLFGMQDSELYIDFIGLGVFFFIFRIAAYIVLKLRFRYNKI